MRLELRSQRRLLLIQRFPSSAISVSRDCSVASCFRNFSPRAKSAARPQLAMLSFENRDPSSKIGELTRHKIVERFTFFEIEALLRKDRTQSVLDLSLKSLVALERGLK
jgi:hypothetical protein